MAASFTMRQLIEAGVHFGHKTKRWNPQMAPYIYGVRNDTHIVDLGKTVPMLRQALHAIEDTVADGGRVLFVGTKRQASDIVAQSAKDCGMYYINMRWLGGLLTNWKTIMSSIRRLKDFEAKLTDENYGLTKKERLQLSRECEKLEKSLGGIKDMGRLPDIIFIIDTNKEDLAVLEAVKLSIPIVAVVDTNAKIEGITFPIPGNDDATRAIQLYCDLVAGAVRKGAERRGIEKGIDFGAAAEPVAEEIIEQPKAAEDDGKKVVSTTKKAARAETGKKAAAKKAAAKDEPETDTAA